MLACTAWSVPDDIAIGRTHVRKGYATLNLNRCESYEVSLSEVHSKVSKLLSVMPFSKRKTAVSKFWNFCKTLTHDTVSD